MYASRLFPGILFAPLQPVTDEEQQTNRQKDTNYDHGEDHFETDHFVLRSLSATSLKEYENPVNSGDSPSFM
jgi:hypothetical protein